LGCAAEFRVITFEQYFADATARGYKPSGMESLNATALIAVVNSMLADFAADTGEDLDDYPQSSGFRTGAKTAELQAAGYGAATSGTHTTAHGIDILDRNEKLDGWLTDERLERYGLYREHPDATVAGQRGAHQSWCHVQDTPPGSGHRTFRP
jgi:hypothetical protein